MKEKPRWVKDLEVGLAKGKGHSERLCANLGEQGSNINQKYQVSNRTKSAFTNIKSKVQEGGEKSGVTERLKQGKAAAAETYEQAKKRYESSGLAEKANSVKAELDDAFLKPVKVWSESTGLNSHVESATRASVSAYGKIRATVKPYFAPETPKELLETTKSELIYIHACILQVSRDEAENLANKLGRAIASKIAGAASAGSLLALVSTFGTASTGTAIASLSGAASTSATLAWVGGLFGGGMAAGAALTGGVALAVGYGVYKVLGSTTRIYEDLSEGEQRIIEATGFLIAAINDVLEKEELRLSAFEAELLLNNTLRPLHQQLHQSAPEISANLDQLNRLLFEQHAIVDFERSILAGFEHFLAREHLHRKHLPEFAIAGVIYALITQSVVDGSPESQMAMEAIRRIKSDWADASEAELTAAISGFSSAQLQGLANNAKGIYHEMLFVKNYNESHDNTYAELFPATNHPGADVQTCRLRVSKLTS
jgi:hypothetical protein